MRSRGLGDVLPVGSLFLRAVLEPLPCYLADARALILRRHLPRLVKVSRRQQAIGEQEVGEIGVRNSRESEGAVLRFTSDEWHAFLGGVRNGEFDRFCM